MKKQQIIILVVIVVVAAATIVAVSLHSNPDTVQPAPFSGHAKGY